MRTLGLTRGMRPWPSQRLAARQRPAGSSGRGFTLLEMLVVMVLIGMVTGVVFPALSKWFDTLVVRSELSQVQSQLRRLPAWAGLAHQTVLLQAQTSFAGSKGSAPDVGYLAQGLPAGWQLQAGWQLVTGQWVMHASGLCEAGQLVLLQVARQRSYRASLLGSGCEMAFAEVTGAAP
jgi:general secretion pathway protein G